jgi:hypothetical protein
MPVDTSFPLKEQSYKLNVGRKYRKENTFITRPEFIYGFFLNIPKLFKKDHRNTMCKDVSLIYKKSGR